MHCRTSNATIFLTLSIATAACNDTTPSALTGDNAGTVVPVRAESAGAGAAGKSAGSAPMVRVHSVAVDEAANDAGTLIMRPDAAMENPGTANLVAGSGGAAGHPQQGGSGGSGGQAGVSAGSGGTAQTSPGQNNEEDDD